MEIQFLRSGIEAERDQEQYESNWAPPKLVYGFWAVCSILSTSLWRSLSWAPTMCIDQEQYESNWATPKLLYGYYAVCSILSTSQWKSLPWAQTMCIDQEQYKSNWATLKLLYGYYTVCSILSTSLWRSLPWAPTMCIDFIKWTIQCCHSSGLETHEWSTYSQVKLLGW